MTHEEIQILISAYFDGEVTPSEKNIVQDHLSTCQSCQKDYKMYTSISSSLSKWSNEALSPDEEMKLKKRIEQRREPMFTKRTATIFVTTLCLTLVIGSVLQVYTKKGMNGRLRAASDVINDQILNSPFSRSRVLDVSSVRASAKYEPARLASNYSNEKDVLSASSMLGKEVSARALGGSEAYYGHQNTNDYYATDEERKKIQKADISLLVENAFKIKSELTDLILRFNGIIVSSQFNRSKQGAGQGTMVCKVYPKDLQPALQKIRKLGEVEEENESSADMTDQFKDAQENINKYASDKDRLQKSLSSFKLFNPTTQEEKNNIERQIAQTQDEINALERVIKFYKDQTSMSVIVVNFHDNFKSIIHDNDAGNNWKAMLKNKWTTTSNISLEVFSNIFFGIIYMLSFLVPILIWCAIFGLIYFIISLFFKK